jgi:quinol monooxygenase YgiN
VIIVIARFRPRPERRDDLVTLLEEVQAASRRDDGCLHYGYYAEITDPLTFIAVEEWRDREALAAHLGQSHVARLIAALPELGAGRPEIAAHEVAATRPLPLPR